MLHERLLQFEGDGVRLTASAWGNPEAPAVCFFHGGGQSRRAWSGAARAVAHAGYWGMTFDLRGHGDSGWAKDGDYLLNAYARDVERLVAELKGAVTLVGASRGGQAALVAAARCQDRIKLVMLADVAPTIEDQGVDAIRRFLQSSLRGFDTVDDAADALATYLGQRRATTSGLRKALREKEGRYHWHWDPLTVSPEFLNPPSEGEAMAAAARGFRKPLVLVRAEHSALLTDASVTEFRRFAPQLIVEEAKGAHHMFTGDRNDDFATRLLHHLES